MGELGSAFLALFPSHILGTPSLLTGGVGRGVEKSLTLCKYCSAVSKTSFYYLDSFHHKSKTETDTSD